jgi:hypothetical protein
MRLSASSAPVAVKPRAVDPVYTVKISLVFSGAKKVWAKVGEKSETRVLCPLHPLDYRDN